MAKVTPAIPGIGLPCASAVLPVKFTRRGTVGEDDVVATCWASTTEQNIEIPSSVENKYPADFIRSSVDTAVDLSLTCMRPRSLFVNCGWNPLDCRSPLSLVERIDNLVT